ncbi:MAG: hypothetical protein KID00_02405 [Clostridium argentinense]|uniref:ABC-2 family transporter protein n=1 Tax=Clostridium faecium TaxID=2762223 RepID=A0ABR8YSP4_9CLOT|nr:MULTISPECIES: hypothetical protein [Clostridium]MBD8047172.1 hypothetical protein [Clostridium faecium]MBS5822708.1 hypothetical protein [Clostridium argentinense]MDU1348448.1 hypothetical protein [Clostridium argentinense]
MISKIKIELKLMGINAISPIFIMAIPFLISLFAVLNNTSYDNAMAATEIFVPIASAWITIFAFKDILTEDGSEVVFSYGISRLRLGIVRALIFYLYYIGLLIVYMIILCTIFKMTSFTSFFTHLAIEGLFTTALAFFLMSFTYNCEISLSIIIIYIVSVVLVGHKYLTFFVVLNSKGYMLPLEEVLSSLYKCMTFTVILFIIGQIKFNKFTNFK